MRDNFLIFLFFSLTFFSFIASSAAQIDSDSTSNNAGVSVPLHLAKEKLTEADLNKTTFAEETRLVSVSRSEKELKDIPSTVYVVTKEEILENGFVTLVDVLKTVPWIKVSQPGSGTLGEMFLMRGQIGNEYTKILINNVPIQPAVSGGLAIGAQLPIAQAERIEIVYGPSSAVYGADAVAGVINIITQTAEKSAYAQANGYFGTDNYRHVDFLAGGKAGRDKNVLQYSIYGNLTRRDDLPLKRSSEAFSPFERILDLVPNSEDPQIREFFTNFARNQPDSFLNALSEGANFRFYEGNDPFQAVVNPLPEENYLIGVKFNYRKLQISIDEMYSQRHSSIGRTPAFFSYADPENYIGETIRRTHISYQTNNKKSSFLINGSYLFYRYDANSSFGTVYDIGNGTGRSYKYEGSDDFFLESIYTRKIKTNFELTGGVSTSSSLNLPLTNDLREPFNVNEYWEAIEGDVNTDSSLGTFGFNNGSFINVGAFAQGYYTGEKWVGVLGIRGDLRGETNPEIGSTASLNPRLAILYKLTPKLSARASVATAFRSPSPSIRYASIAVKNDDSDSVFYQQVPNPDLSPEASITTEVGLRYFPNEHIYLDLTGYFTGTDRPIVGRFQPIDRNEYPLASALSGNNDGTARVFFNDQDGRAAIYGMQGMLKVKNIIENIHLDTDLFFSFTQGGEVLPDNGGTIDAYRMQPNFMGQWRISLRPSKKWYINLQNVLMSSWYRRNIDTIEKYEGDDAITNSYYTLDMLVRHFFNKNVSAYFRMNNVFNANYGGIGVTGTDVDAVYNPQLMRNIQTGVSFRIN